jgi:hypothetical protein
MLGASRLIRANGAPLDDYFLQNIFRIFSEKVFKKVFKNISKLLCIILLSFVLNFFPKICHFQSFPSQFTSLFTT